MKLGSQLLRKYVNSEDFRISLKLTILLVPERYLKLVEIDDDDNNILTVALEKFAFDSI